MNRLLFVLACVLFLVAMFLVIFDVNKSDALNVLLFGGLASLAAGHAL